MSGTPDRRSWVRSVYLYLAALVGLVLIVIGGVQLVDLGLRALVFTQADAEESLHLYQPPFPVPLERVARATEDTARLSAEEVALMRQWVAEYRRWEERRARIDPLVARRQRTAASSLAFILVGLPLYLYHWGLIRRESRRRGPPPPRPAAAAPG